MTKLTKWIKIVAMIPSPDKKKSTPADNIALLVSAAKKKHPGEWSGTEAEKSQRAKIELAYEQYAEALRQCATTMNAKDEPSWAVAFVVRHRQYDRRDAKDALGTMFDLRHHLIDLTDEGTVIELEVKLPLKKVELKATSPDKEGK